MYPSSPDRTRLAEAGTVLAKAFHDDPFFVYVFPRKCCPHATPGAIGGCAVWRRPGASTVTDSREVESGLVAAIDTFLADDRARLTDSEQHGGPRMRFVNSTQATDGAT